MKPTDKQLADPKWWDENAPEGATHFDPDELEVWGENIEVVFWLKRTDDHWFAWHDDYWFGPLGSDDDFLTQEAWNQCIERPTSQPTDKPEWDGEGSEHPPIGAECECTFAVEQHDTWHKGKVCFHGIDPEGREFFIVDTGTCQACYRTTDYVRPLKTQYDRNKDELKDLSVQALMFHTPDVAIAIDKFCDAILARYELKERN